MDALQRLTELFRELFQFDLARPFAYTLEALTDDGAVRKPVDVVETFNYLYGLRVRKYEPWNPVQADLRDLPNLGGLDTLPEYRAVKATDREGRRRILVLWRDMAEHEPETERAFLEAKIAELEADGETWDEILINGDTPTPGIASLDPLFKRLMMAGENTA